MYLLKLSDIPSEVNDFYLTYRDETSELLGFWPSENTEDAEAYFTCHTEDDLFRFVPVFYEPEMLFDDEDWETVASSPALYFMGCDDGSTGIHVESKEAALEWLKKCPYVDFNQFLQAIQNGRLPSVRLHIHH